MSSTKTTNKNETTETTKPTEPTETPKIPETTETPDTTDTTDTTSNSTPKKSIRSSITSSLRASLRSMMDIDSIHIILILILVASNLYYYSLIVNRNIDYNDEEQINSLKKTIGLINLFVGIFLIGIIILKIIQQKLETKKSKLLATIFISFLGMVPIVLYLIQIVQSFQNKNDAYNLLVRCRNLLS